MNLGKAFRSLFKATPKQEPAAGWSFTIQSHHDLKRQTVYVSVADEARAKVIASETVTGLMVAKAPVTESVLADLGVQRGQHKLQAGHGWSFSIQGPSGADKSLVFVYLSDEQEAETVAVKIMPGTILSRTQVPSSVIAGVPLRLQPGGTKVI